MRKIEREEKKVDENREGNKESGEKIERKEQKP